MRISPPQCRLGLGASGSTSGDGASGVVAVSLIDRLIRPTSARSSMPKFFVAGSLKLIALGPEPLQGAVQPSTDPHATVFVTPFTVHDWLAVGASLPKCVYCNGWVFTMLPPLPSAVGGSVIWTNSD